jgi:hypothetical protein
MFVLNEVDALLYHMWRPTDGTDLIDSRQWHTTGQGVTYARSDVDVFLSVLVTQSLNIIHVQQRLLKGRPMRDSDEDVIERLIKSFVWISLLRPKIAQQ